MSRHMTQPTKLHALAMTKAQISMGTCLVWSEIPVCIQCVAKDPSFLHADIEDSIQTGRMPRLISLC